MNIEQILASGNLEKSVLIGYYGGGNYGDELLLEVLAARLRGEGVQNITITYQDLSLYKTYHRDFGYPLIQMGNKVAVLRTIVKNKTIIVGGGGLWGLDVNPNIFLLSLMLFASRWLLGKSVYLLGVGYYNSTNWYGRLSAWVAGKAATQIVARDHETYVNFQKITKHVSLDADIAWQIAKVDLLPYRRDFLALKSMLPVASKTLFITLRRFKRAQKSNYNEAVEAFLAGNEHPVIVALMEPRSVDPEGYERIKLWQQTYRNVHVIDFSWNPLALFVFFKEYRDELAVVAPQFHVILTAYVTGVLFLPIAYDNKVSELLKQVGHSNILSAHALARADLEKFANAFYGSVV